MDGPHKALGAPIGTSGLCLMGLWLGLRLLTLPVAIAGLQACSLICATWEWFQAHRLLVWPLLRGLCIDEQAFTVNGIGNGADPVAGVCSCLGISHVLVACTDSLGAVMPH